MYGAVVPEDEYARRLTRAYEGEPVLAALTRHEESLQSFAAREHAGDSAALEPVRATIAWLQELA
jgi:hypothetical protein